MGQRVAALQSEEEGEGTGAGTARPGCRQDAEPAPAGRPTSELALGCVRSRSVTRVGAKRDDCRPFPG